MFKHTMLSIVLLSTLTISPITWAGDAEDISFFPSAVSAVSILLSWYGWVTLSENLERAPNHSKVIEAKPNKNEVHVAVQADKQAEPVKLTFPKEALGDKTIKPEQQMNLARQDTGVRVQFAEDGPDLFVPNEKGAALYRSEKVSQ
ncbi:hypothetical protein [Chitinivorax sp. B]|uniref:hypothetical protein n=1 Tax=Chitinivorax sp. B TaxID=2502235 RepID=UPI0010F9546A|nr:hypothetical protein [Chitinivorax sp. B]